MEYPQDFNNNPDNSTFSSNNYHSYSLLADNRQGLLFHTDVSNMDDSLAESWNNSSSVSVRGSQRGIAGFVSKLYQCLQSPQNEEKYARWCKHQGRDMFIIERIPEFTEIVLPRLFKHCKFPSFVRQLNIYGFQRDTDARKSKDNKDKDTCRWYHPYFKPGRRDLFHLIRRKATRYSRKKKSKGQEDPETILKMDDDDDAEDLEEESIKDDDYGRQSFSSSSSVTLQYGTSNNIVQTSYVDTEKLEISPANILENNTETNESSSHQAFNMYQNRQQNYYPDKLAAAHNTIREQQMHINRLEAIISSKTNSQEDYISTLYSSQYYNQAPSYNNNLPQLPSFSFRNPVMPQIKQEDTTQAWIPCYANTDDDCHVNK